MNRKTLALAILLLIAGLAPASAIIGFCQRMPCCHHAAADPVALSTGGSDCCTTITCYESPSAKLAAGASAPGAVLTMPLLIPGASAITPVRASRGVIDTSPPISTRQRLATLSTLLI